MYKKIISHDYKDDTVNFTIMLTDMCSLNCSYCCEEIPYCKTNSIIDIDAIIKFLIRYNNKYPKINIKVSLYGGESTLHPKIIELCNKLENMPFVCEVQIFTNLTSNIKLYLSVLQFSKVCLFVSYHTNKILSKKTFIDKLNIIKERYFQKRISINIMLENNNNFQATYQMFKLLELDKNRCKNNSRLYMKLIFSTSNYTSRYTKEQMLLYNKIKEKYCSVDRPMFTLIDYDGVQTNIGINNDTDQLVLAGWRCSAGKHSAFINYKGEIYPCNEIYDRCKHNYYADKKNIKSIYNENIDDVLNYTICNLSCCYAEETFFAENISNIDSQLIIYNNFFEII